MIRSLVISLLFFFLHKYSISQNLTGTWDGVMSGGEKLQVNIRMKQQELCGYTADFVISRPSSYCKANFKGWYDKEEEVWVLVGTSFIENSGDHILMILRLWHQNGDPDNILRGTEEAKYGRSSMLNIGDRGSVRLRKISSSLPKDMPNCFPQIKEPPISQTGKEVTIKPSLKNQKPASPVIIPEKKPTVKTNPVIPKKAVPPPIKTVPLIKVDTTQKIVKPVPVPIQVPVTIDQPDLIKKMKERKKTEFSHLIVTEKNITLSVYDNGIVDNDTVSIFYNGKLIAGKKRLSEKPIVIHLELDEDAALHEIVMFAENLGTIPPNTALIVVTAGDKRYELHSSASLTENAVLTFEYKPK